MLLLLLLLLKQIFGSHKIQIWFFTQELKNKTGKSQKISKISKKRVKSQEKNVLADGSWDCQQKDK